MRPTFQRGIHLEKLNLSGDKNVVFSDRSQADVFSTLKNVESLNLNGLTFAGDYNPIETECKYYNVYPKPIA